MKRQAALLAAAALALTACGAAPGGPETRQDPDRVISDPGKGVTAKRLLQDSDPVFGRVDPEQISTVALLVCGELDRGTPVGEIGELATDSGFTVKQAASIVAVSIVVFCPWNEGRIR